MITITEAAAKQIKKLIADDDDSDKVIGIRLSVRGGCSGLTYDMQLIEESTDTDKAFEAHGVTVYTDPKSYLFLQGITMDYVKNMMGQTFVFNNPNATGGCGCGTSFSVD